MRREPLLAGLLCLVGAFLVLVAAGRAWVSVDVIGSALLPDRQVAVGGSDLSPGLPALGLVGLAGVLALAATRGRGRLLVGLLLLAVGVATVVAVLRLELDPLRLGGLALISDPVREAGGAEGESFDVTGWSRVAALGGVLVALAGLLVAVRGRRWAALGRRYEPPAAPEPPREGPAAERDLWEALDRGEDPTGSSGPVPAPDPAAREAEPRD